jgi:hypothetical protein
VRRAAPRACEAPVARDALGLATYDEQYGHLRDHGVAALACDLARVVTVQLGEMPNSNFGAPAGDVHADFAHNTRMSADAREIMTTYQEHHAQAHVRRVLDALAAIPESDGGSLLDHTLVVWVSELGTGTHDAHEWPAVLAGGGAFRMGRYVSYARDDARPLTRQDRGASDADATINRTVADRVGPPHQKLWVSIARAMGLSDVESFGDESYPTGSGTLDARGALDGLV